MSAKNNIRYKLLRDGFVVFIKNNRIHLLPVFLLIVLLILTCLRISGTSVGIYNDYFYGAGSKDNSLLYGKPQSIRSDEWLVATQLTIAQASNGYKKINTNYSEPKDLSILVDVPSLDWPTVFKPQNFAFFIVPLEFAFAFKWWLLLFALLAGAYYFFLRLFNKKIIPSILSAAIISFAPFVFWWYQTTTILPLAYGFFIMLISMSIVDKRPWKLFGKRLHHAYILISKSLVLSYLLISFALILYVPYLVPIALVVAAYIIGYILNKSKTFNKNDWFNIAVPFIGAIVLAAGIGGIFIATHYSEIHTITNTSYPGKRDVLSGGSNVRDLLVTYLQPRLQAVGRGDHYIINQSESSSFILLPLFFILPAIGIIIWLYIKKRRIEWMLVCLVVVSALFAIHLFVPGVNMISKIFLLNLVPQLRLLVGLGLLGLILSTYTVLVIKSEFKLTKNFIIIAFMYTIFYLILIIAAGIEVSLDYPAFISSKKLIFALAITSTAGLFFLLVGKLRLGLGVLAIFSIASIVNIHPLYVGLGPIYESEVTSKIDLLSDSTSSWAVANDIYLENIPQMSDRKAITGVNPYPSLNFWKKYSTNEEIYNRYAHIFLTSNDAAPLILVQSDLFAVSLSCSRPINNTINYILSTTPLVGSCNKLIDKIVYPAKTFYFYSVNPISRNQ